MPEDSGSYARLRTILRYSWFVIAGVAVFVAWIFFARWQEDRRIEQRALEKQRATDQRAVELLGGKRFEILHFYASPGLIRHGETAQLCYGVSNAKKVRLEPSAGSVWPSFNRCVAIAPGKDTTYTLTAEDAAGHTKTATLVVQVR